MPIWWLKTKNNPISTIRLFRFAVFKEKVLPSRAECSRAIP